MAVCILWFLSLFIIWIIIHFLHGSSVGSSFALSHDSFVGSLVTLSHAVSLNLLFRLSVSYALSFGLTFTLSPAPYLVQYLVFLRRHAVFPCFIYLVIIGFIIYSLSWFIRWIIFYSLSWLIRWIIIFSLSWLISCIIIFFCLMVIR